MSASRRFLRYAGADAQARATRLQDALAERDGLPRCNHPKHTLAAEELAELHAERGRVMDCPCTDPADPDPTCRLTSWDRVEVLEDPDEPGVFYVHDEVPPAEVPSLPTQVATELAGAVSVERDNDVAGRMQRRGDRRRRGRRGGGRS